MSTPGWNPRALDPRWVAARETLQARYAELSGLPDASRLAHILGATHSWTEENVRDLWVQGLDNPIGSTPTLNHVYLHVPFCKSICNFCNYERLRPSSTEMLDAFVARVLRSIEVLAPVVASQRWHTLYLGGGTPSVLPPRMLDTVLTALDRSLQWHEGAERSFEFDPAVMNADKLSVLRQHGFNHFSFGIQTLRAEVNAAHNRGSQSKDVVARRFNELYDAGIYNVSVDFLGGLKGTTPAGLLEDLSVVLEEFHPDWVDIFMLTPTRAYVDSHFGGSYDAFWEHIQPFQAQIPEALPKMSKRHGYRVMSGKGHRMQLQRRWKIPGEPTKPDNLINYSQLVNECDEPLHLLGFGPSARSKIFGVAHFQAWDPGDTPLEPGWSRYEGQRIDLSQEIRSYLIFCLRDADVVDRVTFRHIFGLDLPAAIPAALAVWTEKGWAKMEPDCLRLVNQDRRTRTEALLWLLPDSFLEHQIARWEGVDLSHNGVRALVHGLEEGTTLAGGLGFAGVQDARLLVQLPSGAEARLRIAPPLDNDGQLRLILETPAPHRPERRAALRRAVHQVRGVVRHNHAKGSARLDASGRDGA